MVSFVAAGTPSADSLTTRNVAIPTHSAGDFLVLHFHYQRGPTFRNSNEFALPSGWQWLFLNRHPANASDTLDAMTGLAWKFGDGAETTVTLTNTGTADPFFGVVSAWSGVDTIRPFDVVGRTAWLGGANPVTINGVTTTVANAVVANFFASLDNGTYSSVSDSTAYTLTTAVGDDAGLACNYKTVASPGASGSLTFNQSIADLGTGLVVAFNPSGETPTGDQIIETNWAHGANVGGTGDAVANITGVTTDHLLVGLITYEGSAPTVDPAGTILDTQTDPAGWTTQIREWTPASEAFTIDVTPTSTNTASIMVGAWVSLGATPLEVSDLAHSSSSGTTTPTGPTVTVATGDATGTWVFSGDDNQYTTQAINDGDAVSYTRHNTSVGTDNSSILVFTVDEVAGTSTGQSVTQSTNGPDNTSMFSVAIHPLDTNFDGSAAVTEGDDTSAATGDYTPEAISGTSAATEGDDISAASGAIADARTGTATPTEGNDTSAASGTSGGVVTTGPTRHWFEVWTRPGDPNFGRVIDDPPFARASIHAGMNLLGDGTMDLPNTFDRFDEILYIDRNTPANSISSLVRCYADSNPLVPVHEWIPSALTPTADKNDPDVNAAGKDINIILTYPRTEPVDWDGSDAFGCTACDWIWGGRNLLVDWDFENPIITPTVYELVVTATGGSYTIGASSGTSPTSAITFNAGAATIEAEIESDLSSFPDVLVADASSTNPFRRLIQYVDPPFGPTLVVNTGSLTGGSATLTVTQQGGMKPSGWTPARAVLAGLQPVGFYTTWETSDDQNHTPGGQFSLKIDPGPTGATSNRNGGAQQVVSVTPGQTYQASVWIYPTSATDRFRLNISTIGEEIVATSGGNGQTLTANTWNQISVPDVVIPDGVTQVIFRVQNTSPFPANPAIFYVDDAEFNEGLNAASPGEVVRLLYESYVDPTLQGTIYWDDGSGTDTPYLTLDFSDTLDSAGAPWDETDVELRVYQRMNLFQVLSQLAGSYGVEFRVTPDDVENGTWALRMYNEGGMGSDYTAASTPAVLGGSDDTRRQLRRFLPVSDHVVEGEQRVTGRARNTGFISSLGKIAGERIEKTATTQDAALAAATEDSDDALLTGQSWDYEFTDPLLAPLTDYNLGDTLNIHDPPEADGPGRVWDITGVFSPERERWEVEYLVEES